MSGASSALAAADDAAADLDAPQPAPTATAAAPATAPAPATAATAPPPPAIAPPAPPTPPPQPTSAHDTPLPLPHADSPVAAAAGVADPPGRSDSDSLFEEDDNLSSYASSMISAVRDYKYENGRRYHVYREGQYVLPNDEDEQNRQDLLHHVRNLTLGGALYRAPISPHVQRVLDVGTGTGIWAIDFADQTPSAEVIGTDLSPIQPGWVPPNLHFQVEDAESPWLYQRPFDFIHTRDLGGSISDWPRLLRQARAHLRPGGWIELQEFEVTLKSDDDTLRLAPHLCEYLERLHRASEMFHKPMNVAESHKQRLADAGFEEVRDEVHKVPSSGWPRDPRLKEIGRYNLCSLLMAVEAYSLALFTRVLGWSNERTQVFLAGVRKDLKNPKVHSYCNLHVVYGRKPLDPS